MVRKIIAAVIGFFVWNIVWVGTEKIFSALWPDWYGAHQAAFENAVINGGVFTPDTTILLMNIVRGALLALLCGYLTASIARENRRAPLILAILLFAFGVVIMAMSKSAVPLWYAIILTALLIPMPLLGGKLRKIA